MLTIRQAQMDELARVRVEDFHKRLAAHLEELAQRRAIPIDKLALQEQVRRGTKSATRFFRSEKDIARYCEIVFTRLEGWNDQDHPDAVLELLRAPTIATEQRLNNFELWTKIKKKRRQ